jgi:hypothetical protein
MGLAEPLHVYSVELAVHVVGPALGEQLPPAEVPLLVQQKSVAAPVPAVPAPQLRDELLCGGVSEPAHEYPVEPAAQLVTVVSSVQVFVVVPVSQQ